MHCEFTPIKNYLLITPCKNEGKNLPSLIDSVRAQTIKPLIWFILDDGSTDDTLSILNKYQEICSWIRVLHLEKHRRDLGLHLAEVINLGFKHVIDYCNQRELEYNYLGNLDADLTVPPFFYENLMKEFEKNPKLGIASGGTKYIIDDKMVHAKLSVDEPSGGHMLIRKKCFEDVEGFPISSSSDSVLKTKARLRGWETKRFENNLAIEIRDVSSAEGLWKGALQDGKSNYYLNYNPMFIIIKSGNYFKKYPHYIGFGFLGGYFGDLIRRKSQTEDEEIRTYFWKKWDYKDLRKYLIKRYLSNKSK